MTLKPHTIAFRHEHGRPWDYKIDAALNARGGA